MDYRDCLNILKENYCRGGQFDSAGMWRYTNGGNILFLAGNNGGWAFICTDNKSYMTIIKYSIQRDGEYKNGGKYRRADTVDLIDVMKRSTKYAILTPQQEAERIKQNGKRADVLNWIEIGR